MCKGKPGSQFYRPMKGDRGVGVLVSELAQNSDTAVLIVPVTASRLLAFLSAVTVSQGLMSRETSGAQQQSLQDLPA